MTALGDFHVHTPYCLHGSLDAMERYIENALQAGLTHLSFTEHAPLPEDFHDPVPDQDSSMKRSDVEPYLIEAKRLQRVYQNDLTIKVGFEVDYITGFEKETQKFLDDYGSEIEDSILSVHMLKLPSGAYGCLDFSSEMFGEIAQAFGSVDQVHAAYYKTVAASIQQPLGSYKPNRIGHMTLVNKFQLAHPPGKSFSAEQLEILKLVKEHNYELDLNTAGLYKPLCKEIYPAPAVIEEAVRLQIPLVPGSDSHAAAGIAKGFPSVSETIPLGLPKAYQKK